MSYYTFTLKIRSTNSANYAYINNKLKELMDDKTYIGHNSVLEIKREE